MMAGSQSRESSRPNALTAVNPEQEGAGDPIVEEVRRRYARVARQAIDGRRASCCGEVASEPLREAETESCCGPTCCDQGPSREATIGPQDPISRDLYSDAESATLPEAAVLASLGCGNPTALAELSPGEVVLDLGSGGGIDVLLSARRVGPEGKAYGLDMTEEMLELARRNQAEARVVNAEFLQGRIEAVPLPDASIDVILSNCVINLSTDKDRVFAEAVRVLRPGGRLAVADMVVEGSFPEPLRRRVELWSGCIAGALEVEDYRRRLETAGFADVEIEITRTFGPEEAREAVGSELEEMGLDPESLPGRLASAFVRARKPA